MIRMQFSGEQLDVIAEGSPKALIAIIRAISTANDNAADYVDSAQSRRQLARALFEKAALYLDALRLEKSPVADQSGFRALQLGLLQDFVEVHNAALKQYVELPEHRDDLNKLLA